MIGMTGFEIEIGSRNVVQKLRDTAINDATGQLYTAKEWEKTNGVTHILRQFGWAVKRNGRAEYVGRKA
jgi:hypothetical protein